MRYVLNVDVKLLLKKEKMIDYKKQGKKNRAIGADFERRTRKDLESKGWIISRWGNNIELIPIKVKKEFLKEQIELRVGHKILDEEVPTQEDFYGKLIPAKSTRFRSNTHGFPDFISYRRLFGEAYEIAFVECKTNGYLSQIEKEKAKWYLENKLCSKFFIAYKTKIKNRVKVEYKTFELK